MHPVKFPYPVRLVQFCRGDRRLSANKNLTDLLANLDENPTHMVVLFADGTEPQTMRERDGLRWLIRLLGKQLELLFLQ